MKMPEKFTIRQARTFKGLTQEEIANKLGISRGMYRSYEKYETLFRADRMEAFSKAVGLPIDKIIFLPSK